MNKKIKRIILTSAATLLTGVTVAANVLYNKYYDFINDGLNPTKVTYDEKVLEKGNEFVSTIVKEGVTMLKNTSHKAPFAYDPENPTKNRKVNIFGWSSIDAGFLISGYGSGISRIPENKRVLLYKGFDTYNQKYPNKKIEYNTNLKSFYEDFCSARQVSESLGGNDKLYTNYNPKVSEYTNASNNVNGKTLLEDAKEFSDSAIIVLSRQSGEAQDCPQTYTYNYSTKGGSIVKDETRGYLSLSDDEIDMIDMVKNNFDNVTVLLNCTNMIECGAFEDEKIDNVYYIGVTGQSGASTIPMILTGDINPSGRITETLVTDHKENPSFYNFGRLASSSVTYVEDIYVGYKWYETADKMGYWDDYTAKEAYKSNGKTGYDGIVQYPFGSGLSYTTFDWEIVDKPVGELIATDQYEVSVKVTNTGDKAGKEVVELFYEPPYKSGEIEKSSINLIDYAKTKLLEPGESETVKLSIDPYYMASYDCYDKNNNGFKGFELDAGEYIFKLMVNAHEIKNESTKFSLNLAANYQFAKDPVTNNDVKNRFTGADATNVTPLDRNDTSLYLSRADFKNTFKNVTVAHSTANGTVNSKNSYDTLPTFGQDNGLYLYTNLDGSKITDVGLLKEPDGTKIKANSELMKELGADYNNEKWDLLLNQVTIEDAEHLIAMGGYSTCEALSVGKIWLRDNDGPMGLTRSNASVTETSQWTWFPMAGLIANSFNKALAEEYGNVVANEGVSTGVSGWYAPGANIRRSPFGGRNNEYYSEDPILSGYSAAYTVKGALKGHLYAYIKHFALNDQETNRGNVYTWTTEQALRENYLRPFEIAVKVGKANAMMSAFNRVGGVTARQCYPLLTEILRDEWGFNGSVVTDWMGSAGDAKQGIAAGNDLWLNGAQSFSHNLGSSWASDMTVANNVRKSVKNILFTVCSTEYYSQNETETVTTVTRGYPYFEIAVVGVNFIFIDAIVVMLYFAYFSKSNDDLFTKKNKED